MTTSPKDEMWTVFKRLLGYIKQMKGMFMLSVAGLIIYGLVDAAFIAFIGPFIDKGFSGGAPAAVTNGIALPTSEGFHANNDVLMMAPFCQLCLDLRHFIYECTFDHGHASASV